MVTEEMYEDVSTIDDDSLSVEFKEFLHGVYQDGFNHGQDLVTYNINDVEECEDKNEFRDRIIAACWEADDNYRQYSPFEFFCNELNNCEDPDLAWELYENGISDGIEQELDEFFTEETGE